MIATQLATQTATHEQASDTNQAALPNNQPRDDSPARHTAAPDAPTPRQRWAHLLVLDIINANLPLPALAKHLNIPFDTLVDHINTPEVRSEIDAYEELCNLRARLLGEAARPISIRKLLDVLESPAPRPTGRDPEADQRTLHRHAELIRRTATTIARESRALAPKPASKHAPARPAPPVEREPQKGAPSASSESSEPATDTCARDSAPTPSPTHPAATSSRRADSGGEAELVRQLTTAKPPTTTSEPPTSKGSSLPSQPVHAAGAHPDHTIASTLKNDANSAPSAGSASSPSPLPSASPEPSLTHNAYNARDHPIP